MRVSIQFSVNEDDKTRGVSYVAEEDLPEALEAVASYLRRHDVTIQAIWVVKREG